jgi:Beta-lactamase enzyme family
MGVRVLHSRGRARARHSRATTSHWPAILLAVAGTVVVAVAAFVLTRLLHGGSADLQSPASAASPRRASVTVSPSSPPRLRASPRPAMHGNPLGTVAQSYLATRLGTVLAAVYDARTGQVWVLGQGKPQAEASIVKLDILETLLAQHRANGTALSARDMSLAQAMIEDSDNDAATSLWYEVGGARGISSFNAAVGLVHTTPSNCVDCRGFPWPGWGLTTTTPADQIALLRELLQSNAQLTDAQREYALGLMENVTASQRWGVTGGVPLQATVALKNGWLPLTSADDNWQINSIGWVSGDGRNYLMAVLTTGDPTEQYGIDTIDQLSAIVWGRMR